MSHKHDHQQQAKHFLSFEPRNAGQRQAQQEYPDADIQFLLGPAGTGKSICALACALREILFTSSKKKTLYLLRPPVEASSKSLGFLPGELQEKLEPFTAPLLPLVHRLIGKPPPGLLQTYSLAHSRGATFDDCVALVDEAQNLTCKEFKLLVSRLGRNARMVFCGDPDQSDIRPTQRSFVTDLDWCADKLLNVPGVSLVEFSPDEIVRHPRLHLWLKALAG